uniref:Pentatricopeptide repeat-containing protein n=1 Tax=Chenopodium quinoa TaxID=63459 RepID=A0A803L0Q0_CHEQI
MEPVIRPGPVDPSVLRLQTSHRSHDVWSGVADRVLSVREHMVSVGRLRVHGPPVIGPPFEGWHDLVEELLGVRPGHDDNACKVFDEMLEREVEPSVVTYNSLIGFMCKKGDVGKGKKLLDDMIRKRKHPNAVTYAHLMEGLCALGKHNEAKKMMFDMEYRGCKPRLTNFGVLMTDFSAKRQA